MRINRLILSVCALVLILIGAGALAQQTKTNPPAAAAATPAKPADKSIRFHFDGIRTAM